MNTDGQREFLLLWDKYFPGAELPITFQYTDEAGFTERVKTAASHRCIFADLSRVRGGQSLCFAAESIGCFGGKRYAGFSDAAMPNFEFFLSCGISGKLAGERYKKSPELVKAWLERIPKLQAHLCPQAFRWRRMYAPSTVKPLGSLATFSSIRSRIAASSVDGVTGFWA